MCRTQRSTLGLLLRWIQKEPDCVGQAFENGIADWEDGRRLADRRDNGGDRAPILARLRSGADGLWRVRAIQSSPGRAGERAAGPRAGYPGGRPLLPVPRVVDAGPAPTAPGAPP